MKTTAIYSVLMTLFLLNLSCYGAERPAKKQKTTHADYEQRSCSLQEVIDLDVQIRECAKKAVIITTTKFPPVNLAFYLDQLKKQRNELLSRLPDRDYVQFWHHCYPDKVFEGDRASRRNILKHIFCNDVSKVVEDYVCRWEHLNMSRSIADGIPPNVKYISYSHCSGLTSRHIFVTSASNREVFDADGASHIQFISNEQLQERYALHEYASEKISPEKLVLVKIFGGYSKTTLELLEQGRLFDIPATKQIELKENE